MKTSKEHPTPGGKGRGKDIAGWNSSISYQSNAMMNSLLVQTDPTTTGSGFHKKKHQ
jgi:hypothetical protein